jgi:hypothetical protein
MKKVFLSLAVVAVLTVVSCKNLTLLLKKLLLLTLLCSC